MTLTRVVWPLDFGEKNIPNLIPLLNICFWSAFPRLGDALNLIPLRLGDTFAHY